MDSLVRSPATRKPRYAGRVRALVDAGIDVARGCYLPRRRLPLGRRTDCAQLARAERVSGRMSKVPAAKLGLQMAITSVKQLIKRLVGRVNIRTLEGLLVYPVINKIFNELEACPLL